MTDCDTVFGGRGLFGWHQLQKLLEARGVTGNIEYRSDPLGLLTCLLFFHHYNSNVFNFFLAVRAGDFLSDDFNSHSTFQISESQIVSRWGLDGNVFIEFIDLAIDFVGAGLRRRIADNSFNFNGFCALCLRKAGDE